MKKQLVLIHGRQQQIEDAAALKARWLETWSLGLRKGGLSIPNAADIRLVYYGDALSTSRAGSRNGAPGEEVESGAGILGNTNSLEELQRQVLEEVAANRDVLDFHQRGISTAERVKGLLSALNASDGVNVALLLDMIEDVHRYFSDTDFRTAFLERFREQVDPGIPAVIVGHGVGTVLAYDVLGNELTSSWTVPRFVTLGSPLGIGGIREKLRTSGVPTNVERWFNARDPIDDIALLPLDLKHFPVRPPAAILDKSDVRNRAANHHDIEGYLDDADVARWIHFALQ